MKTATQPQATLTNILALTRLALAVPADAPASERAIAAEALVASSDYDVWLLTESLTISAEVRRLLEEIKAG